MDDVLTTQCKRELDCWFSADSRYFYYYSAPNSSTSASASASTSVTAEEGVGNSLQLHKYDCKLNVWVKLPASTPALYRSPSTSASASASSAVAALREVEARYERALGAALSAVQRRFGWTQCRPVFALPDRLRYVLHVSTPSAGSSSSGGSSTDFVLADLCSRSVHALRWFEAAADWKSAAPCAPPPPPPQRWDEEPVQWWYVPPCDWTQSPSASASASSEWKQLPPDPASTLVLPSTSLPVLRQKTPAATAAGAAAQLSAEEAARAAQLLAQPLPPALYVGNTHQPTADLHRWTVFVSCDALCIDAPLNAALIAEVTYGLHPSFIPNRRTVSGGPDFSYTAVGWGTFEVNVTIRFANPKWPPAQLQYRLSFDAAKTYRKVEFALPPSQDAKN